MSDNLFCHLYLKCYYSLWNCKHDLPDCYLVIFLHHLHRDTNTQELAVLHRLAKHPIRTCPSDIANAIFLTVILSFSSTISTETRTPRN